MVLAVVANGLLMALVALAFHFTRKALGVQRGMVGLLFYWIGFEWLHYNWNISWPWLNFGNMFATRPDWVQWYEYTGVLGGTLWILLGNILVWLILKRGWLDRSASYLGLVTRTLGLGIVIGVPIFLSFEIRENYEEKGDPVEVLVLQPNVDPYEEKFPRGDAFIPYDQQFEELIDLTRENMTPETRLVVGPETALPGGYWEKELPESREVERMGEVVGSPPYPDMIIGLSSYRNYGKVPEKPTPTARSFEKESGYYDAFNSALMLASDSTPPRIYHKSRLVLGVEKLPFPWLLSPIESLFNLGGISGSLGTQKTPTVFEHGEEEGQPLRTAPLICYESIYGEYVTEFANRGANLLVNITNDGWWSNTPGYRQHLHLGKLRAIETRRSIVRSANTGISCFVDQLGRVKDRTPWWEKTTLRGTVRKNGETTYYMRQGDAIGRLFAFMGLLFILYAITKWIRDRNDLQVR